MADHDDDFQVTARAHHALAALPLGDVADAVALATAAGNRARDRLAFDEAARWYRRAHDAALADSLIGPRRRAELLLAEGAALRSVLSPRAEDVLAEAAAAADGLADIELLQRVVVTWAYRHGGAVFGPELRKWVVRALEAATRSRHAAPRPVARSGRNRHAATTTRPGRGSWYASQRRWRRRQRTTAPAGRRDRRAQRLLVACAARSNVVRTGTEDQRRHRGASPGGHATRARWRMQRHGVSKSRCVWATCRLPSEH